MKQEAKIAHITTPHGDTIEITDAVGHQVILQPDEALLVLQFLYERADEITRLVNGLPGADHESIEEHLQELSEAERRQAEGE